MPVKKKTTAKKTPKKVNYGKKFIEDFEKRHHINIGPEPLTVEQRLQEASLANANVDEESIILHELENIKLYLFDVVKRLDRLENHFAPMVFAAPIPEFDRNALYKGPNANKGQDFVRKNVAQILKNMLPEATLAMMPKEVREAYHNILSVMGKPNDPIWEKEHAPDPREPVNPANTFQTVTDLWNNVAENMKKLDGVNLTDEIAKAAAEVDEEKEGEDSSKHESDQ